jgi:aspartate/methionine/tyrosine aminotransferase
LEALKDREYLKKVKETFKQRRNYLYSELKRLFEIEIPPEGAFYIWANVGKYTDNSLEFAYKILEKVGVAITPGVDFGKNNTKKYIRFSYANSLKRLEEGVNRLKTFLANLS